MSESSDTRAMLVAASELALGQRWHETVEMCLKCLARAPELPEAWWLLAQSYDALDLPQARDAYAEFHRHSSGRPELQAYREFAAGKAGIAFAEASDTESFHADNDTDPVATYTVSIGGKKTLVQVRNDSGKPPEDIIAAAEALVESANPFEAWHHLQSHPELLTGIGDTILTALALAQSDVRARSAAEIYRDALRRVRDGAGVAPFAEMARIDQRDFTAFVTAVGDLQGPLQELAAATSNETQFAILKKHPMLVTDERCLVFLRILGGLQRDSAAREHIQALFTLIRRARRSGRLGAESVTREIADLRRRSELAAASGDVSAIDAVLDQWNARRRSRNAESAYTAAARGQLHLARYEATSDAADLENACAALGEAMQANTDPDSFEVPYYYGLALMRRFEHHGRSADLEIAIEQMRSVLDLVVDGTRAEGAARSMLGSMLMRRALQNGSLDDLDESIAMQRLAITADAEPAQRAGRLANLATACVERFQIRGSVTDLDDAESLYEEALGSTPSRADALTGIARVHRLRYETTGQLQALDAAVETYRRAIGEPGDPLGVALLHNNLSSALRDRFLVQKRKEDIDQAVAASRIALSGLPEGHSQRPLWLHNLANTLRVRAEAMDDMDDRRAAIAAFEEALRVAPEGSEVWRSVCSNLGAFLRDQDPERAIALQQMGFDRLRQSGAAPGVVTAAEHLGRAYAARGDWLRAGDVMVSGLEALEALQRAQLSSAAKTTWLSKAGELHLLAAEALLHANQIERALTTIERGRGRLLAEALQRDRGVLERLEQAGDAGLVERYRVTAERVRMLTAGLEQGRDVRQHLEAARQSLDRVTAEVERATGIAISPAPPSATDIVELAVAARAPLVYLVPLSTLGVAIVVSGETGAIELIPLPSLTRRGVDDVVERYIASYRRFSNNWQKELQQWLETLDETMRSCWEICMRDVVAHLARAGQAVLIPVGRLGRLPLHAARGDESAALDALTWRYAPGARAYARTHAAQADALLGVGYAPDARPLRYLDLELSAIQARFARAQVLKDRQATFADVVAAAPHADVLHFACHASAADDAASSGGLELADDVLVIPRLLDLRLRNGSICVLSACETGVFGERLPDEVSSIASAMLQAGASGVVSSLWSVPDESTAILMSRFYHLWRETGLSPPVALREAQLWMRDARNEEIADFLRSQLTDANAESLIKRLERQPAGSAFGHAVHWAAFTYTGR